MVQLTDELVRRLDEEAARQGVSRSSVVRDAVTRYLSESGEAAIIRRIVEGYTKVPPAIPDEWGDLEAQADRATRETLQRLDAEEKAQGRKPW